MLEYLYRVAGDFTAGFTPVVIAVLVVAVVGARALWLRNRDAALLTACVVLVPTAAFVLARFGQSTSPESRHLIFVLPFFALLVALGLIDLSRKRTPVLVAALVLLMSRGGRVGLGQDGSALQGRARGAGRGARGRVRVARPHRAVRRRPVRVRAALPRRLGARPRRVLGHRDPPGGRKARARGRCGRRGTLGRGVWVFDASDTNNFTQKLTIPLRYPNPKSDFEARVFGPFLVIRSKQPTRTPKEFLIETRQAQILGRSLGAGDADVNLLTADQALWTLEK